MKTDNFIAVKKMLVKSCVETANQLYGYDRNVRVLHLWVYAPNYLFILDDREGFSKELLHEFKSHLVHPLYNASINIHSCKPDDGCVFGVLIPDAVAYSYEYDTENVSAENEAHIVKLHLVSTDKPLNQCFTLNSKDKKIYKIGRVPTAYDSEGCFRVNDIIISDEHISRAQADLYFSSGKLFLRPTRTGYRPNGNPTRVHVTGKRIPVELCDEFVGYQLQNGDIIELGGTNGVLYNVEFE